MTPAIRALEAAGVPFTVHEYQHDPDHRGYGVEAAEVLGLDPDQVFKTLLIDADGEVVVAIVPVAGQLALKAVGAAVGAKRVGMCDPTIAQRVTGYVLGGISPFGQRKRHRTVIDETCELFDVVYVSAGRRGLEVGIAPADLIALLDASTADIAGS
jgi:Cys-tRNA(Pro)/Cys-tRNA(Cys) deacylase